MPPQLLQTWRHKTKDKLNKNYLSVIFIRSETDALSCWKTKKIDPRKFYQNKELLILYDWQILEFCLILVILPLLSLVPCLEDMFLLNIGYSSSLSWVANTGSPVISSGTITPRNSYKYEHFRRKQETFYQWVLTSDGLFLSFELNNSICDFFLSFNMCLVFFGFIILFFCRNFSSYFTVIKMTRWFASFHSFTLYKCLKASIKTLMIPVIVFKLQNFKIISKINARIKWNKWH